MKKSPAILILLLFMVTFFAPGLVYSIPDFKVEKDITVPEKETYPGSLISLKGQLDVKGSVSESIMLVGGRLILDGVVEEDVICIASKVKIGKNAIIKRDLFVIGGTLDKNPGAVVKGEFFFFKFDLKKIENTIIPFLSDSRTLSFFKAVKILLWFIIALVIFAVVPKRVNAAEAILEDHTLKIGAIGLLSLFSFIFLLFIFILLSFVIIGIPLLIFLVLLYGVVFVFGQTVLFYTIGLKLLNYLKRDNLPPVLYILAGVVVYAGLKFLPLIGPILLIVLNIFNVGIGIAYFLRKKMKFADL